MPSEGTPKSKERPGGKSGYHSPLRARQAAETRRAIVSAAVKLFRDRGWAATTLPMVAAEAGTAVDTIYSAFGTKSGLLMEAVELAIAGDDDPKSMVDRPEVAEFGIGNRDERLRTAVHFTVGVYERSVPILRALQEAAASDDTARARLDQYDNDRRDVMVFGLGLVFGRSAPDTLVEALWALVSPEVWSMLTDKQGWSAPVAEDWLVAMANFAIDQWAELEDSSR